MRIGPFHKEHSEVGITQNEDGSRTLSILRIQTVAEFRLGMPDVTGLRNFLDELRSTSIFH